MTGEEYLTLMGEAPERLTVGAVREAMTFSKPNQPDEGDVKTAERFRALEARVALLEDFASRAATLTAGLLETPAARRLLKMIGGKS
jgi:hypothetical protein